jgi:4-aminobutyrate aminotransferase
VAEVCLNYIEQTLFHTIAPPRDVAAIIVEPIQGEGGYVVPAPGFMQGLRHICDQYGILLICDEVQSGIGRTGKIWGFEHEGIVPDIVASAKGNTYGGNALACAAAYEVLSLVEEELAANAAQVGSYFMQGLHELAGRYEQIGQVRGRGLMIGLELVKDRTTREPARKLAHDVMEEAFRRGLLLLTCGASTIRFCPPLVLTEAQVDEGLALFEETLSAVLHNAV